MSPRTLIHGGIVVSMVQDDAPRHADVLVEADRIVSVGDPASVGGQPAVDNFIDANGCIVMPGLINTHTHSPMTIMRGTSDDLGPPTAARPPTFPPGQDWPSQLTPDDHYWSSRLAIAEMIRGGTTTFVDMYHDMDRVAQAVIDSGVRGALGWEILTFRNDPNEWLPYDEPTARRTFEECAHFASEWHGRGDGRVIALIAPHECGTCHEPWLSRSADLASQLKRDITIHVAESQWELDLCLHKYGRRPVEVLADAGILDHRVIGAHNQYLSDTDYAHLAASEKYTASACLGAYMKLAEPPTPVARLLEAGVRVSLGTDSAVTNNNLNLWEEIHLAATLPAFLAHDASLVPAQQALRMATIEGAKALGLEQQLGTLAPGKKADLIVLDARHPHLRPLEGVLFGALSYSATGHEVRDVMVDGRLLMRAGEIVAFDENEVLNMADATVRRLRQAVGLPERYERP
jgi:5-methylthioadenosine/S-adenosylhomocysteine deaminase